MKKTYRNGFTLVELLAVIIIIAVVIMIAVPIVLEVIEQSKKSSLSSSVHSYVDVIERELTLESSENDFILDVKEVNKWGIKGETADEGWFKIVDKKVVDYSLKFNNYIANYDYDNDNTFVENGGAIKQEAQFTTYNNGDVVYFNPDTNRRCYEKNANSDTGTKTGCMRWYIFDYDGSNNVKMILDHNTTAIVIFKSDASSDIFEAEQQLQEDVKSWNESLKPRLITANEVAKITGADVALKWDSKTSSNLFYLDGASSGDNKWNTQVASEENKSKYAWLFDNTNDCIKYGCNTSDKKTYGYWTADFVFNDATKAWGIRRVGSLSQSDATGNKYFGIRPVIVVPRQKIG